jgi:hypothetical protein
MQLIYISDKDKIYALDHFVHKVLTEKSLQTMSFKLKGLLPRAFFGEEKAGLSGPVTTQTPNL